MKYLLSLLLSIVWNFTINRKVTFKSANNVPVAMAKLAFYYVIFIPTATYLGDLAEGAGVNEYIVLVVTMLSNLTTAFLVNRFWIYKDSMNTNKLAEKEKEKQKLNKMKTNWTDQDNMSYIESIEEYKKVVIDSAESFKNNNVQPTPSRLEE